MLEGYGSEGGLRRGEATARLRHGRRVGRRRGGMELEEEGRSNGTYYRGYDTGRLRRGEAKAQQSRGGFGMDDGIEVRSRRWGLWAGAWVKSTRLRRGGGHRQPSHERHTKPDWDYLQLIK